MKKTVREFPQSWEIDVVEGKNKYTGSVLQGFSRYCENFYETLENIEKYDKKEFNKLSPINIEAYKSLFNEKVEQFYNILLDTEKIKNTDESLIFYFDAKKRTNIELSKFRHLDYCNFYKKGTLEILKEDYIGNNFIPREMRITDNIYPTLKKLANEIFNIEEMIAETTKQMWQNQIVSDIHNFNKEKYGMFVKVICDWREENQNDQDIHDYMENRLATSTSYITNNKSKFFMQNIGAKDLCGLVFSADGFICANSRDAYLEEYIDGKCPLKSKVNYSNVNRIVKINNHDIYSESVQFCTPKVALYSQYDNYNEVILDKRKSKPIAAFYVDEINGEKVPNAQKLRETAEKLAFKFRVPVIALQSNNYILSRDEEIA